ncbi:hypothetical protein NE865_04717 [Phthorimaea operculella]|nr:hypothetical protein NE865_04717 [Phthorimaea operculella]
MMVDIPNFKRCCVCLPLRYGLLIWGYLIFISFGYILMYVFPLEVTFSLLAIGNIAVTALLVVAAHEKSSKLIKIYNKCAFGAAIATFIFYTSYLIGNMPYYSYYIFRREYYTSTLLGGLFFTAMQIYIIAIVRSEIKKETVRVAPIQMAHSVLATILTVTDENWKKMESQGKSR